MKHDSIETHRQHTLCVIQHDAILDSIHGAYNTPPTLCNTCPLHQIPSIDFEDQRRGGGKEESRTRHGTKDECLKRLDRFRSFIQTDLKILVLLGPFLAFLDKGLLCCALIQDKNIFYLLCLGLSLFNVAPIRTQAPHACPLVCILN